MKWNATTRNKAILDKCKELVTANYKEPGQDGMSDDCTRDVLQPTVPRRSLPAYRFGAKIRDAKPVLRLLRVLHARSREKENA